MVELATTLCSIIKGYREKEGASLEVFSEKLGISKTLLQNIERGEANPTLETVEQIAKALGVSPLLLLSGDYDADECKTAWIILDLLEHFGELSAEDQRRSIDAFGLLVEIFSKREQG